MLIRTRAAAALSTAILTVLCLAGPVMALPQHVDELDYAWSGSYYVGKLVAWDWTATGSDPLEDPGWSPQTYWARTQPMGTRLLLGLALGLAGESRVVLHRRWVGTDLGPQLTADPLTPRVASIIRAAAVGAAALGLALIAARLGWWGFMPAACFLAIPHVRDDLARGWAEGPLTLGLGLCVLTFGTRWLAGAIGLATTFKLTALGLWPLLLWPRATRLRPLVAFVAALLFWSALTPPSWFSLGPFFLGPMLRQRWHEYATQNTILDRIGDTAIDGVFLPTRYLLPVELLALVMLAILASRFLERWDSRVRRETDNPTQSNRAVLTVGSASRSK
jgi:hypothetical protein